MLNELLDIWYCCLIDHHKEKDCHFSIKQSFCCYQDPPVFVVEHDGYLYSWCKPASTYEEAVKVLQEKLIWMIREECDVERECDYSPAQQAVLKDNLKRLEELLNAEQTI